MASSPEPVLTQELSSEEANVMDILRDFGLSGVSLDIVMKKEKRTRAAYIYNVQKYLGWYQNLHEDYITKHGDESV